MTQPSPQTPAPALAPPHLGVRLFQADDGVAVQALRPDGQDDPQYPAFLLPRIASSLMEKAGGITRALWTGHGRLMALTLYLDCAPGPHAWAWMVPSQRCTQTDCRCRLDGQGWPALPPSWRLAGSFWSKGLADVPDLAEHVPDFQGLHVFHVVERDWLRLSLYLRYADGVLPTNAEQTFFNESEVLLPPVMPQLQLMTHS